MPDNLTNAKDLEGQDAVKQNFWAKHAGQIAKGLGLTFVAGAAFIGLRSVFSGNK